MSLVQRVYNLKTNILVDSVYQYFLLWSRHLNLI